MSAVNAEIGAAEMRALAAYLAPHVPELAGRLRVELIHGGRSNLTYRLTDGMTAWVLRRGPLGTLTPSAHDMAREFTIVAALYGTTVPVARPVVYCSDPSILGVPFSIVEHVGGTILRTSEDLAPFSDAALARCAFGLVDTMVALHGVDYAAVGLASFGRPEGYLARQVFRWHDQWRRVATRSVPDLDALHARLAGSTPAESGASIVHGDIRIDNAILAASDVGEVRALVDWEMATLGDPIADLALHVVYRDAAFAPVLGGSAASTSDRMPSSEALVERYASATGSDLPAFEFYLALGYFKTAVIAEGIHARYLEGDAVGDGYQAVGAAVPALAANGLRALGGSIA